MPGIEQRLSLSLKLSLQSFVLVGFIFAAGSFSRLAYGVPLKVFKDEFVVQLPRANPRSVAASATSAALGARIAQDISASVKVISRNRFGGQISADAASESSSVVSFDGDDSYCQDLVKRGVVESCSPNYFVTTSRVEPTDPSFGQMWGLQGTHGIGAPEAWDLGTGSSEVVVGIIDTGIDYNHPDLAGNIWINPGEIAGNGIDDDQNGYIDDVHGINTITRSGNPMDDNEHGTHVAGTIGARANNGIGVVGINHQVKLMGLKFLSGDGGGSLANAIRALDYAVMMKGRGVNIRLTNNSWGGGAFSQPMHDAIERARVAGIIFVAAAGNESNDNEASPTYPGSYDLPNVISVAAHDRDGNLASFSNYGSTVVDISAPGVGILSTVRGSSYKSLSGTSMATPHVTGALALLIAAEGSLSNDQVITRLYESGSPSAQLQGLVRTSRELNVNRMVRNLISVVPPSPAENTCNYSVEEASFLTDYSADNEGVVVQADELNFHTITLPFSFPLHAELYDSITLSPNGVIYFKGAPASIDYLNGETAPRFSMAALHSDLTTVAPGGVRVSVHADRVTIFWKATHYNKPTSGEVLVRTTLFADGRIEESLDFASASLATYIGAKATIGIRGAGEHSAVTFSSNNGSLVTNGLRLRFTPDCSMSFNPVPYATVRRLDFYARSPRKSNLDYVIAGRAFVGTIEAVKNGKTAIHAFIDGKKCMGPAVVMLRKKKAALRGTIPALPSSVKRVALKAGVAGRIRTVAAGSSSRSRRMSVKNFNSTCERLVSSLRVS